MEEYMFVGSTEYWKIRWNQGSRSRYEKTNAAAYQSKLSWQTGLLSDAFCSLSNAAWRESAISVILIIYKELK